MPEQGRHGDGNVVVTEIADVDELDLVLPEAQFGLSRIDRGTDVIRFASRFDVGVSRHQVETGFSNLGEGAVDHSTLVLAAPTAAGRAPTIWEGTEATVGRIRVYGPGTMLHGVNGTGLRLEQLDVDYEALRETAEVLGVDIGDWEQRGAWLDESDWAGRSILAVGPELDPDGDASALLSSVALALSSGSFDVGSRRTLSSTEIVRRSFEYLEATGSWRPPIVDLCRAASVSERGLRQAFVSCFDRPPSVVLRLRALTAVRRVLRDSASNGASVSGVAARHGFRHLGDFARYDRATFGEKPSQTLRTAASTNRNGSG